MSQYVFNPPGIVDVPVRGSDQKFPVRRIFCVGRNYEAHAKEMGVIADHQAPFYFTKSALAYVPTGSTLAYPPGTSNYHYEMELVVAIGTPVFNANEEQAWASIYGYACGLDMTRRDLQLAARDKGRPWDLGKDFEESAVLASIVPAGDVGRLTSGKIELRVNGAVKQSSDLKLLIHNVPSIIADLSKFYHLQPGDLIYTGTPDGVGPLQIGDTVEGSIDALENVHAQIA